ncbi:hypothetical protein RCG67_15970 [Kocuria sp. CPCC 205292]|uniref:DoxX family protein n=1 Tax=Kocuria cellulosilytica TaxID=3071451 RepID=UPI0034D488DB
MIPRPRQRPFPAAPGRRGPRGGRGGAAASPALRMGAALCTTGTLHLARPALFDGLIPRSLPGAPRTWTLGSGAAELGAGALLLHPRTRRAGGWAAAALLVGVWPGNVTMAWRARRGSPARRAVTLARLPLQIPMIAAALHIARTG